MRMLYPTLRERRAIDDLLTTFFRAPERGVDFKRAIGRVARFYDLPAPRIRWFEWLDWGKTAGRTHENGSIHLVHPDGWKRGRKWNSERQWINTVYHEMGHYILWADAERKADGFAYRFVRGVSALARRAPREWPRDTVLSRARRKRKTTRRPRHGSTGRRRA